MGPKRHAGLEKVICTSIEVPPVCPEFTMRIVRALCASGILQQANNRSPREEIAVHHTTLS